MTASLEIKAFCQIGGKHSEIRRFCVPENVSTIYAYIEKKLELLFHLKRDRFSIFWKDSDGDYIRVSSEEEMKVAISHLKPKFGQPEALTTLVLLVDAEELEDKPEDHHVGVVCDGCDGRIRGTRYKCLTCPDFDLCSKCKTEGIHDTHRFMGMELRKDERGRHHKKHRSMHGNHPARGRCGPWGRGPRPNRWDRHDHHERGPFVFYPPFLGEGIPSAEQIHENAQKVTAEVAKQVGGVISNIWTGWAGQGQNQGNGEASGSGCPFSFSSANASSSTKTKGPFETAATSQSTSASNNADCTIVKEIPIVLETERPQSSKETQETTIDQADSVDSIPPMMKKMTVEERSSPPEEEEEWAIIDESMSPNPPTVVSVEMEDPEVPTQIYPRIEEPSAPSSLNMAAASLPEDIRLKADQTIAHLLDMGYSDDQGWLTTLCYMKKGNLNDVLDLLMPKPPK